MIHWIAILLICFTSVTLHADSLTTTQAHSTATFVTTHRQLTPGINRVGLQIVLEPEWHTYWINPGDSAAAPIMNFELPDFITASPTIYPTPKRIPFGPLQSFGYENEVLLMFELDVQPLSELKKVDVVLNAEWLVCKEECIPGIFRFSKTMEIVSGNPVASQDLSVFDEFFKKVPKSSGNELSWATSGSVVELTWNKSLPTPKDILPFTNQLVSNNPPSIETGTAVHSISESPAPVENESFLFLYEDRPAEIIIGSKQKAGLLLILAMAFLGGLILNIMPCVLPILSLKAMMLVQTREAGFGKFVASNLFYTLGVIVSFVLFALAMVGLNASGQQLGWGFQLQSPGFVIFLIGVFIVMGLMFMDLLPVSFARLVDWSSKSSSSPSDGKGSFMTGVLAVVVASPCTAPFMGAAMGYSLGQPAHVVVAIFVALGLGLAFPFLAVCISPSALKLLPKPGNWMNWVKKLMAVPMFITALWLAWVLQLQLSGSVGQESDSLWENYNPVKLETYKNDDRPVFLNATAAWCISCQVNDKVVFQTEQVRQYFKQRNFHLIKADWTNKNAEIASLLRTHNRVGVPLYLYFPPGESRPRILPEVLTVKSLLSTLEN